MGDLPRTNTQIITRGSSLQYQFKIEPKVISVQEKDLNEVIGVTPQEKHTIIYYTRTNSSRLKILRF